MIEAILSGLFVRKGTLIRARPPTLPIITESGIFF